VRAVVGGMGEDGDVGGDKGIGNEGGGDQEAIEPRRAGMGR